MTERSARAENSAGQERARAEARLVRLYLDALRAADAAGAYRIASGALAEGMTIPALYQRVLTPAMHKIGELWEKGALTVADEHLATTLTHRVLAGLRPPLRAEGGNAPPERGRVVLATVQGERHALGLRMAADVLEDAGFEAIYLGADVPTDALLHALSSLAPDLLALSVTVPELAPQLDDVAEAARRTHPQVGLLVGGRAASPLAAGGTLVRDLEVLAKEVERPPQV